MARKVKWGILSTARIGVQKVIPAMQRGRFSEVVALASRDEGKARSTARQLGIPRAYSSYRDLLLDPEVEAVYNPLPNHLHVPGSIRAAEAGKHVLCEKPIGLSAAEASRLIEVRDRTGVKMQEAFMVRTHPQWLGVVTRIREGQIGRLTAIQGAFSYFNRDAEDIRNRTDIGGGGGLMDIGCYPINTSRLVFDEEPRRVVGVIERDPEMGIDRLTSAILDYPSGQASFLCGTQMVPYQRVHFFGSKGRLEIEIPFNAPPDRPCRVFLDDGDLFGANRQTLEFETCDQYTIQGDRFSEAVLKDSEVPTPLEDAVANMKVIEAVFRSAESGRWEKPA